MNIERTSQLYTGSLLVYFAHTKYGTLLKLEHGFEQEAKEGNFYSFDKMIESLDFNNRLFYLQKYLDEHIFYDINCHEKYSIEEFELIRNRAKKADVKIIRVMVMSIKPAVPELDLPETFKHHIEVRYKENGAYKTNWFEKLGEYLSTTGNYLYYLAFDIEDEIIEKLKAEDAADSNF